MIDSAVQYRRAQPAESDALVSLILAMALESEGQVLDEATLRTGIEAVFQNPTLGVYWVIANGDTLIGCTLITTEWSDWNNAPYWWVQSLYIQPEWRGQGLFEKLLSTLEVAARSQNVRELRLYVEQNNQRAIRVYRRSGFESDHYRCMTKPLT